MTRTRFSIFLVLSLLCLQCYYSSPVGVFQERNSGNGRLDDPTLAEENAELFEGDIEMDESMKHSLIGGKLMSRDAVVEPIYHWPKATVAYAFDKSISFYKRAYIKRAFDYISSKTCIKFKPRKDEKSYVQYFTGKGCYSRIGRDPKKQMQKISIGIGCERLGTIEHETMHALGFFHEHTRPDRDEYITIDFNNIKPKHVSNFKKYPRELGSSYGKPYDYNSVMHYSEMAFSKNDEPTIRTRNPEDRIGQRVRLSDCDIFELNKVYCNGPKAKAFLNALYHNCMESIRRHDFFGNENNEWKK